MNNNLNKLEEKAKRLRKKAIKLFDEENELELEKVLNEEDELIEEISKSKKVTDEDNNHIRIIHNKRYFDMNTIEEM